MPLPVPLSQPFLPHGVARLALTCSALALGFAPGLVTAPAQAQSATPGFVEDVVVIGRRASAAERLNATGPRILAVECASLGAKLIHFSTDQVFDGSIRQPREEDDSVNPLNVYARTKLEGEKHVLQYSEHLVLRVQWLYGRKKDRFTLLRDKATFSPFADQYGAPTWTLHLAATVADLADRDARGLFHFAYDDSASWAEVFEYVKEVMGYSVKLEPRETASLSLPAKRPLYSVMSNRKLLNFLGQPTMGSWKMALNTFLSGVRN